MTPGRTAMERIGEATYPTLALSEFSHDHGAEELFDGGFWPGDPSFADPDRRGKLPAFDGAVHCCPRYGPATHQFTHVHEGCLNS
jgi:hypothetical protein